MKIAWVFARCARRLQTGLDGGMHAAIGRQGPEERDILVVASILALISCFIVPPDKEYAGYIHASTISQLICLMLVVCGFQRIGVFRIIGSRLLHHVKTARGLVLTLIALPFFSGMLITNDVALVTFVPFAIAVLTMAHMEEHAGACRHADDRRRERGQHAHPRSATRTTCI